MIDFMNDEYSLVKTTQKSYPVSEEYSPLIGKKYSQLPSHMQDEIWDYQLSVQEVRGWDDVEIRKLFRRLNSVVERLNMQEMRHSQYFGEFVDAVETLAKENFWDDLCIFTRRDSQRMKDIEFVSELFVCLIDGPQDQQKKLDEFYAKYDVCFEEKKKFMTKFRSILHKLNDIGDLIRETRFSKKADFYSLFAAMCELKKYKFRDIDLCKSEKELMNLNNEMEKPIEDVKGIYKKYYSAVKEGVNKLPKRKIRTEIIFNIIDGSQQ